MAENGKIITREEFQKLLKGLDQFVQDSVFDADQKADEHRAPESYRADMKGYSRGLWVMGRKIIEKLKALL